MPEPKNRDPLAIAVAVLSLGVQVGAWFYWGGKIEARLNTIEERVKDGELRDTALTSENRSQDVAIAVITTQLTTIQSTVSRIEDKLGERKR